MYWADRHRFTNFQARRREALHAQAALMKYKSGVGKGGDDVQIDCCQMNGVRLSMVARAPAQLPVVL